MHTAEYSFEYRDEFSRPAAGGTESSSSMSSGSRGECRVDHIWEKNSHWSTNMTNGSVESSGQTDKNLCFTCHATKADFNHDHGQHIDNSFYLLHKISLLFQKQELSDIQIVVGSKIYYSHKLILCASSDVLSVMLTNPSWPDSQCQKIVLTEEPECHSVFGDFLKYMYAGDIHLTHSTVLPVLMLADKYNVCDLRAVCLEFMSEHLVSTVQHNHAVSWMQYCAACGHDKLARACYQFVLWNFRKVMDTKDFLNMEKDFVLDFLQRSDLVVPDEISLFRGVNRWLEHFRATSAANGVTLRGEGFYASARKLLSLIRYPMIRREQLSELEHCALAEELADFFLEKIVAAMNYHVAVARPSTGDEADAEQYKPRNYINETWSTCLLIENYSALPQHDVRPLFFSSPVSGAEADDNKCWEWNVDLFPKGIQFHRCIMIGLWRNLDIGGAIYNSVRLVLATKMAETRNVDVAVVIKGVQDSVEFVKRVVQRRCMFDNETRLCQFKDIVPFDELNCSGSEYLTGSDSDSFKIFIIIKPV